MRKLGIIVSVYKNKLIVVKPVVKNVLETYGSEVYDNTTSRIGLVVDIIGNVSNPYVIVKPTSPELTYIVEHGATLFFSRSKRKYGK